MPNAPQHDDRRFQALLDRWAEGDVTAAEERELFDLAQHDDFRKEAIEGYLQFPEADHQAALARLNNNITDNRRLTTDGLRSKWTWFSAAAAVLLVLIAAWWFFPTADRQQPLADSQSVASEADGQQGVTESANELKSADEPIAMLEQQEEPEFSPPGNEGEAKKARPKPAPEPNAGNKMRQSKEQEFQAAEEEMAEKDEDLADDANSTIPPISAKPAAPAPSRALEERPQPADEFVKRRQKQPEVWWSDLQRYLRTNARLTPTARNNNISGILRLRGHLQPDGQFTDIEYYNTMGYGLEVEAKRLLENYNWPLNKDTLIDVEIKFIR